MYKCGHGLGNRAPLLIWSIFASSVPARQSLDLARGRVLHKSAHLKSMRPATAQTEAAFSIFDNVRLVAKSLFALSVCRFDTSRVDFRRSASPNFVARLIRFRSYRRRPRYARASSRSSRTVVSLNAQLIHRVFSQRLSRTLPSVNVRCPPRCVSCFSLQRLAFWTNVMNDRR